MPGRPSPQHPTYLGTPEKHMQHESPSNQVVLHPVAVMVLVGPRCALVVAAAVLPHGDIALAPDKWPLNGTQRGQARELQAAARRAGDVLAAVQPELILLSSPHAIADLTSFCFFLNPKAAGCVADGVAAVGACGAAQPFAMDGSFRCAVQRAALLLQLLRAHTPMRWLTVFRPRVMPCPSNPCRRQCCQERLQQPSWLLQPACAAGASAKLFSGPTCPMYQSCHQRVCVAGY